MENTSQYLDMTPSTDDISATSARKFLWPPSRMNSATSSDSDSRVDPVAPVHQSSPHEQASNSSLLNQIEDFLFDVRVPPLRLRLERAGFIPDAISDFCYRCGSSAADYAAGIDGCENCRNHTLHWNRFVRLGSYHSELGNVIRDIKFLPWRTLGLHAGRLLAHQLRDVIGHELQIRTLEPDRLEHICLIPVPTTRWRSMIRGIHHTQVLTQGILQELRSMRLGEYYKLNLEPKIQISSWLRRSHRYSQIVVRPSDRRRNIAGSIHCARASAAVLRLKPSQTLLIVVDDVRTSGATLTAACLATKKILQNHTQNRGDWRIWCATLATTERTPLVGE